MRWIHTFDNGDTHQVKCSNCNYKVTYHGDKIPKRCMSCREVPEEIGKRAGSRFESTKFNINMYKKDTKLH